MRGCGRGVELGWVGAGTTGLVKGGGLKESHYFFFLCVDLHAISNTPFLAGFLREKRKKLKKMKSDNCDYVRFRKNRVETSDFKIPRKLSRKPATPAE